MYTLWQDSYTYIQWINYWHVRLLGALSPVRAILRYYFMGFYAVCTIRVNSTSYCCTASGLGARKGRGEVPEDVKCRPGRAGHSYTEAIWSTKRHSVGQKPSFRRNEEIVQMSVPHCWWIQCYLDVVLLFVIVSLHMPANMRPQYAPMNRLVRNNSHEFYCAALVNIGYSSAQLYVPIWTPRRPQFK